MKPLIDFVENSFPKRMVRGNLNMLSDVSDLECVALT